MNNMRNLIGEGRAILASVLCLLSVGILAPSALANGTVSEYVCTDNQWETERNPFALPTTMPHWLSALCRHEVYTNYQGFAVGYRSRHMFGTWFLGTNTYYCTSLPTKNNPLYENTVRVSNWGPRGDHLHTTPSDKTCLAKIERDTKTAIASTSDIDTLVGKRVSLALCQLLRPHEFEGKSGTAQFPPGFEAGVNIPRSEQNGIFISNITTHVGCQYKSFSYGNPLAGQCLDGTTWYWSDRLIRFDNYEENAKGRIIKNCTLTPKQMVKEYDKYYGPGLKNCLDTLNLMPNDWAGTYVLHNRDYKKQTVTDQFVWTNTVDGGAAELRPRARTVTHPDAWPMFDEDVNLDRADVLLLKCTCHALDTVVKLLEAYQLPDGGVGKNPGPEIQQLMKWQRNFHDIGYTRQDRPYESGNPEREHTYRVGYGERIERAFHDFFHVVPTFLKSVDDKDAMKAARVSFVNALECFLDADAFITGNWPSKTGHDYKGQRDSDQLHLFEFAEPEDGEEGGEWNVAGYREIIEKAYASLKGTGTDAAVQELALAGEKGLGKMFGIKAGDKMLDFSGLGAAKDGTVQLDLNPFFDGSMTPRGFVTDVNACVTTNGPSHWVLTHAFANADMYPDVAPSNLVGQLVLNVSEDSVSPTLCGIYPSSTFVADVQTMAKRYPASGEGGPSGFSRYVKAYDSHVTVTTENSPYVLEEGYTYTTMPTNKTGGAFKVDAGATLVGTNVTFEGNSAELGGAIYNAGTVSIAGNFELKTDSDTWYNKSDSAVNWDLTGGLEQYGTISSFERYVNQDATVRQYVSVTDDLPAGEYVLATGDFSDVKDKDTFTVTNVTSGATSEIRIGGMALVNGRLTGLLVEGERLVLKMPIPSVTLSNVPAVDPETGATNVTAVVRVGDTKIPPNDDGTCAVPKGMPIAVEYAVTDPEQFMFGPGWETKSVTLTLEDDYAMTDADKPKAVARWINVREIAIDTRERIVVESPDEVLPIAYSPDFWGRVPQVESADIHDHTDKHGYVKLVTGATTAGYVELNTVKAGEYGPHDIIYAPLRDDSVLEDGMTNVVIYYSSRLPLTWTQPEHGAIAVTNAGKAVASGDKVLGFERVNLTATRDSHYQFTGWTATTNGVALPATAFGDDKALVTTFEMPLAATELTAAIAWQSTFAEEKTVGEGETWEVFADDDYQGGLANNGTVVWKPGLTNALGKTSFLDDFSQLHNGESGKLQIAFDETLTNGTYVIAGEANSAIGSAFEITDGTLANECTVVDEDDLETAGWTYVGPRRFKLFVDGDGRLRLLVRSAILYGIVSEAAPSAAGSAEAQTNGVTVTRSYSEDTVKVVATTNLFWQFVNWTGVDGAGNDLTFADPANAETSFAMPETNVSVTANFIVSESYKAESVLAASNAVEKAKADINALRRLTDAEKKAACDELDAIFSDARGGISGAEVPATVADTLTEARQGAEDAAKAAMELADGKPYDLIVADDFEVIADEGSYDPTTGAFTVNGVPYVKGVNAFTSFADAFELPDTQFTTNVHVYGAQIIAGKVPNIDAWTLDLVDATLTIGIDDSTNLYASVTNTLAAIVGGKAIVFGKVEDAETRAVQEVFEALVAEGAEIVIKAADVTPVKKPDQAVEICVTEETKAEDDVIIVPQTELEIDGGVISLSVGEKVTNDTLVVGKVSAPNGKVRIENAAAQTLQLLAPVKATLVEIVNRSDVGEGAIVAKGGIWASEAATIDNAGHIEADVVVGGTLTITNKCENTLVGRYEAQNIFLTGIDGALDGVTLAATNGCIRLTGRNILTGSLTVESAAATNDGVMAWSVANGDSGFFADWTSVAQTESAAFEVVVDTEPTNAVYVIAGHAETAAGRTFHVVGFGDYGPIAVVVNGGTVYPGSKSFNLSVNGAGELVFTVDWGVSPQMRAEYTATVTNAANAAIAAINAVETLTSAEIAALTAKVNEATEKALAVIRVTNVPMEAVAAIAEASTAYGQVLAAAETAAEGMVRFARHQFETEGDTELDILVYGGSTNCSTAATLNFVKGTCMTRPRIYVDGERAKFPLALNWKKGDREPKTITLKIARSAYRTDRFFTLQLGSEVASTIGAVDVATVTVRGGKGADETPYVRALAWPANGGRVSGSRKLTSARSKTTLRARPNRWATFSGWYRSKADNPEQIDLENGFVSTERAIKVSQDEAGTYFAYFTDVLPVIAVNDPDLSGASGITTNEDGVAMCTVGLNVELPLTFTTAEGDDTGRLSVIKLPKGLKYNRKTGLVTGVPTRPGVYEVQLKGKNRSGTHTLTYTIIVLPMDDVLIGTFEGDLLDPEKEVVGGVLLKVSRTGSITVRVRYGRKVRVFSARGFCAGDDGVCIVIENRNAGVLTAVPMTDASGHYVGKFQGTLEGVAFGDRKMTFEVE